jgi:hypothetical protein
MNALSWETKEGSAEIFYAVNIQAKHTSLVQGPEFEGWKKLSVDAISFANESNALEPPKYVRAPFFPNDAERYSPSVLVWI